MKTPKHDYTDEQMVFVRDNIKGRSRKEMQQLFNDRFGTSLTLNQIVGFIKRNGFKSDLDGRFGKGHVPANKGTKGIYNVGGNCTSFKKGNKPHNYKPVGTERVNTEGYVDVKIADPNKWKAKHLLIWEEANGPVPKSHVVIFGDGNRRNFNLDNLILVSRRQLSFLNKHTLIQNSADLTKSGIIVADIISKINERKKQKSKGCS